MESFLAVIVYLAIVYAVIAKINKKLRAANPVVRMPGAANARTAAAPEPAKPLTQPAAPMGGHDESIHENHAVPLRPGRSTDALYEGSLHAKTGEGTDCDHDHGGHETPFGMEPPEQPHEERR